MQAQTRVGLIVIGLLAVVFVVMGGQAQAETQEVCTTPALEAAPPSVVVCTLRSAYAYGTMQVVQLEILDGAGRVAPSNGSPGPNVLPPLSAQSIAHFVVPTEEFLFSCRVTVLAPLPGYVRLAISRDSTPGYPAQCNPY